MSDSRHFKKVLGVWDILVVSFGAMIGWGWVVSSGKWIQNAGVVGTLIGFVIGGLMIFLVGMTYSELTTAMPKVGGEHVFSYKAFGPTGSFVCTWALILSYIGVVCFEACSLPTIIQYIFPGFLKGYLYTVAGFDIYISWLAVAVVSAIVITIINIVGIKAAAILQTVLTVTIAVVGIVLVSASTISGSSINLDGQIIIGDGFDSIKNILSVAVVAPFFLFGFDVIPQVAEEINIQLKKIGKILLVSIICAVSFYAFVVFAIGFALNPNEISESMNGSGLVAASAMEKVFNSSVMAKILIIGGMCGIVTSWNSFLIGGSRAIYSMAESHMIPYCFAKLSKRFKTPINALILIGILSVIAPFFGRTMLIWISDAASFACCTAYCIVSMSFLVLRKKEPQMHRPYKVKHYFIVGLCASLMSGIMVVLFLIPNSGCQLTFEELIITGGWVFLGLVFYVWSKIKYRDRFARIET
ncbi:amino acid/polyamine/organocation transporter (APC superfamily) [Ruminococcaceae bacterium R-25]|nr:amino acid/polyamine/organocation transporter (APC superfamily) [Ruminococcaceae bacterium R-25]SUQ11320.1 amino acid/polyamine/organocation transporter, APC superfamily [Oscillospiraceae bacterium]